MKKYLLAISFAVCSILAHAQTYSQNLTILLSVTPNADGTITLNWPARTFTGNWYIYKRKNITDAWSSSPLATRSSGQVSWQDTGFKAGQSWEYRVFQVNSSNQSISEGFVFAGNKTTEIPSFGSVILLIDSTYIKPLSTQLATLKNDLISNGWLVNTIYAGRKESASTVKARIVSLYNSASIKPRSLYIIGHVPVPYSGAFRNTDSAFACSPSPDGHIENYGNHTGAWPADAYYGDLNGTYTDNSATVKTGLSARLYNIPGDGKFDQCKIADEVKLEIGRVDLFNMPIFGARTDTVLLRNYLDTAHKWRIGAIKTVERGLVDDNFTSYSLAHTGWMTMSSMVPRDSIFGNRDYFTFQNKQPYLWSHGCGAGSFTNCSGIGGITSFNPGIFRNIFTSLSGSFFGDWDEQNNFLRGPIASGSLCSYWGGIPTWYMHHMGLGSPIGIGAKYTQNSKVQDFNYSQNSLHIALMGDPTTRVRNLPPAGKLTAVTQSNSVRLTWGKAKAGIDGYAVYRIDTVSNTWTRLNTNIITDTFYVASNVASGKYKYAVRPIKLENNPSGSWYNLGGGSFAWINHTASIEQLIPLAVNVQPNPSVGTFTITTEMGITAPLKVLIIEPSGRIILEKTYKNNSNSIELNMPKVASGIYFIRCESGNRMGTASVEIIK